jgi:hypothetical protein
MSLKRVLTYQKRAILTTEIDWVSLLLLLMFPGSILFTLKLFKVKDSLKKEL